MCTGLAVSGKRDSSSRVSAKCLGATTISSDLHLHLLSALPLLPLLRGAKRSSSAASLLLIYTRSRVLRHHVAVHLVVSYSRRAKRKVGNIHTSFATSFYAYLASRDIVPQLHSTRQSYED